MICQDFHIQMSIFKGFFDISLDFLSQSHPNLETFLLDRLYCECITSINDESCTSSLIFKKEYCFQEDQMKIGLKKLLCTLKLSNLLSLLNKKVLKDIRKYFGYAHLDSKI